MKSRIVLHTRTLKEPAFGDTDFGLDFEAKAEVWAMVKSVAGKVFFDGVHADVSVTHEIFIRYDHTVTSETWIELDDGRRVDIVNVEDLEERHEYLRLFCTERGDKSLGATST